MLDLTVKGGSGEVHDPTHGCSDYQPNGKIYPLCKGTGEDKCDSCDVCEDIYDEIW